MRPSARNRPDSLKSGFFASARRERRCVESQCRYR
jgi:hypothetical protein